MTQRKECRGWWIFGGHKWKTACADGCFPVLDEYEICEKCGACRHVYSSEFEYWEAPISRGDLEKACTEIRNQRWRKEK